MSTGRSRRTRDATALATGSALSGLLAYVFFAATTRALGAQAAGPVSVLWSYWTFAGAALTFPVQHWIARTVAAHGEGAVRSAARSLGVVTGTAAAVLTVLAWSVAGWRPAAGWSHSAAPSWRRTPCAAWRSAAFS